VKKRFLFSGVLMLEKIQVKVFYHTKSLNLKKKNT